MEFVRKYLHIIYFLLLFLVLSVQDFLKKGNLDLLNNLLFSFWVVIFYTFFNWAWKSKKNEKK